MPARQKEGTLSMPQTIEYEEKHFIIVNDIENSKFIDSLKGPALTVVIALAAVYCIILGAKFAKAEEPQEREKAKAALKNAIIGFVLIFVLLVLLNGVRPAHESLHSSDSNP